MSLRWELDQQAIAPAEHAVFESMDTLLALPAQQITRDKRSGVSRLCLQHCYYLKTYSGPGNRLRHLLGASRYQRELRNLGYFSHLGLTTPQLVASGQHTRLGLLQSAILVTREVEDAENLEEFCRAGGLYLQGVTGARRILSALAGAVCTFHSRGFYHGDLKTRNILIRSREAEPELFFFDCPRGHHPPRFLLRRCIVRDLAQLHHDLWCHVRKADLLYLYKRYLGRTKLTAADKALAADTLAYFATRTRTWRRRRRLARKQRQAREPGGRT